jgi:hypothetical protein
MMISEEVGFLEYIIGILIMRDNINFDEIWILLMYEGTNKYILNCHMQILNT